MLLKLKLSALFGFGLTLAFTTACMQPKSEPIPEPVLITQTATTTQNTTSTVVQTESNTITATEFSTVTATVTNPGVTQ